MKKTAIILSQFPCIDEVFILRELVHLKRTGLDFVIFSLKASRDKVVQEDAQSLIADTCYFPFFSWKVLKANAALFVRRPLRYLSTFFSVIFHNFKSFDFFWKSVVFWPEFAAFADLAERMGLSHVHGNWATHPATAAWVIRRLTGIPYSMTGHAHDIYLDTTMLAAKIEGARFVTTCTETNKKYLDKIAPGCQEKIIKNYHGVDLERFAGPREKTAVFTILSVGTLLERKGFDDLIKACALLKKRGVAFSCIIAGGGPEEDKLKNLVRNLEVDDRVSMLGRVTQKEIIPLYKKADIFVLTVKTKKHFGIPNVFIESLASGLVPISTALESIHELVIDGESGLIVADEDPGAIADAIERLERDPLLRERLAQRGREIVLEKFDARRNALQLKELLEKE